MNKLKVCVLLGGVSSERNISLVTGKSILDHLDKDKYEVCAIDPIDFREDREEIIKKTPLLPNHKSIIEELYDSNYIIPAQRLFDTNPYRPDLFYIALHGKGGEDGAIQGMLETLNIKYTGSGILGSALAINKIYAKEIFKAQGILVPNSININTKVDFDIEKLKKQIKSYPIYIKANNQGSSIGMAKIFKENELERNIELISNFDNKITIEEEIKGCEITIPIIGRGEVLPPIEIIPCEGEYDLVNKYTPGATNEICPARISKELENKAKDIALKCHRALNCKSISRTDMIIKDNGDIYVLEVNTIPGMTPTSLVPLSAKTYGLSYSELLDRIIESIL